MNTLTMKPKLPIRPLRTGVALSLLALASLSTVLAEDTATAATKATEAITAKAVSAAGGIAASAEPATAQSSTDAATSALLKKPRAKDDHEKLIELLGLGLGIFATVFGIGIAFFAIWIDYRKRRDLIEICHQERLAALDKGLELPPFPLEFCQSDINPKPCIPGTGLKAGLMWLAVGIGLWLFLSSHVWGLFNRSVSAIPAAIGVAYLVYYVLEGRKVKPTQDKPGG